MMVLGWYLLIACRYVTQHSLVSGFVGKHRYFEALLMDVLSLRYVVFFGRGETRRM